MIDDIYTLEELIEKLEEIEKIKDGNLNYPKAFLSLAYCIKSLRISRDLLWREIDALNGIDSKPQKSEAS